MTRILTLLLITPIFCLDIVAQDIQFYFGGNHHFSSIRNTSEDHISSLWIFPGGITDTLLIREYYNATTTVENEYTTYPGFALGFDLDWEIGNKVSFRTGAGLTTTSFWKSQVSMTNLNAPTGERDTLVVTPPTIGGPGCTYTNTISDLGDFERRPKFSLLTLQVPIKLTYKLTERIGFNLGAVLRTPLASNRQQFITFTETSSNAQGEDLCTYVLHEENDRTGGDFSDLTLLAEAEVYWWIGDFGISLGGGKFISNLFTNPPNVNNQPGFFFDEQVAKPWMGGFKILYRLGGYESEMP